LTKKKTWKDKTRRESQMAKGKNLAETSKQASAYPKRTNLTISENYIGGEMKFDLTEEREI